MSRPSFPAPLAEFPDRFSTEGACAAYLAQSRWPDGFSCLRCGGHAAFSLPRRGLFQCKACGYQASVTAGTILHGTRTPPRRRPPGRPSPQPACTILQKLRRPPLTPDREPLRGKVEVDDAYIGG